MEHYVEIRLLPDPEFPEPVLMNALFAKLHRALVQEGNSEIGISFPQAEWNLGSRLRLHGSHEALQRVMDLNWFKGMDDYIDLSEISQIPINCRYRHVQRARSKSSVDRLYRRSVRKGWLTEVEAKKKLSEGRNKYLKLPFLQLRSHSTGQVFRLFIHQGSILDSPEQGKYSSYGLSDFATVPWF